MNSRERVRCVLEHKLPDRIPNGLGGCETAGTLRMGTIEKVREETIGLLTKCSKYPNFVLSSGCDIPPMTPWTNIDALFAASDEFYGK